MDEDDIIAMSPLIVEPGTIPHRIVIRDLGEKFVVHTQCREVGRQPWYHNGDYFYKSNAAATVAESHHMALARAWARFDSRPSYAADR